MSGTVTAAVVLLASMLAGFGYLAGRETERSRQHRHLERHRAYRYNQQRKETN